MSLYKKNKELFLIVLHLAIGLLVSMIPISAKLLNVLIIIFSIFYVVKSKNKNLAVFYACAYLTLSEVFFRMTNGFLLYESRKYLLIVLPIIALVNQYSRSKAYIYLTYIFLLFVSIFFTDYGIDESIRKMIAFNLSGPISLGFFAFFCYNNKITIQQLNKILFYACLPVISMLLYLILYNPNIKDVVTGTGSNFATSGGFGPNQVATVLGFGIFIFLTRLVLRKVTSLQALLELLFLIACVYRGLITFSRGGILTGLIASFFFIMIMFLKGNKAVLSKINKMLILFVIAGLGVWFYTVSQTSGMIENRYLNKNAAGIEKADITTGRAEIANIEINAFLENPIFGVGVGKVKQYRFERTGILAASHNEITRLLSEHGIIGLFAFLILFISPLFYRLKNRNNIYFYSFLAFWFLTINHSAMRIAFPSFIYGLSLLDVYYPKKKAKV